MTGTRTGWLASGFVVALFAVGAPYWQIPYSKVSLPSALLGPGLLVVVVAAIVVRAVGQCGFVPTLLAVGAAVPGAVVARVAVETARDPTSHNLWPFELVIAAGIGLLAALGGALVGSVPALVSRLSSRR